MSIEYTVVRCRGVMVARRPPKAKVAGSNPVGSIGLHFLPICLSEK